MLHGLKKYWVYIISTIILPIGYYPAFLLVNYQIIKPESIVFYLILTIGASVTMMLFPILIIKKIKNEEIKDFGFKLPENTVLAKKVTFWMILLTTIVLFIFSRNPDFREYYRIEEVVGWLFALEILISFLYFLSEEFFFRGFLLFGLKEHLGNKSIIVSNVVFALLHFMKPGSEIIFSFFYGIILSIISIRLNSFIPAAIIHFSIALILNLIIIFT